MSTSLDYPTRLYSLTSTITSLYVSTIIISIIKTFILILILFNNHHLMLSYRTELNGYGRRFVLTQNKTVHIKPISNNISLPVLIASTNRTNSLVHSSTDESLNKESITINDARHPSFPNETLFHLKNQKALRKKFLLKNFLTSKINNNNNNNNNHHHNHNNNDNNNDNNNNNIDNKNLMMIQSLSSFVPQHQVTSPYEGLVVPGGVDYFYQPHQAFFVPQSSPLLPSPLSQDAETEAIVAEINPIRTDPLFLDFIHVDAPITMFQRRQHHPVDYPTFDIESFGNVFYNDHDSFHRYYLDPSYHLEEELSSDNDENSGNDDSGTLLSPKALPSSLPDTDYTLESVPPVAQNMLFSRNDNYYTPFKVNSINIFSKYLMNDEEEEDDEDDEEDKNKCRRNEHLTKKDIEDALKSANAKRRWYSKTIYNNAIKTKRRSPYIPPDVLDSKIFEYTSQYLKDRKCLNKMDVVTLLPKINVREIYSRYEMKACYQDNKIICEPKAKFRSIDGSCNNLKMKTWGKSFTCHRRLLPPDYADGVALPRQAYDGNKLPNARDISSLLLPDIDIQDHKLTSMAMAFGQFIIHDITRTLPVANDIQCCPSQAAVHPECFAIDINSSDDVLFKYFNQTCLNFVRSIICNPCGLGPREQQNQATHTFDLSQMYGLRLNDSLALRTFRGGQLRSSLTSTYPKEELPPKMTTEDPGCNVRPVPPRFKCFETADGIRASQHPALQSLHTAFHRRHNQHAEALAKVNPHWNDEKLYQEARHILIAEVSNMIYGQYLSAVFGQKLIKHFRLGLKKSGYTQYNPKINPSTMQEFITAAGRFGHSQINNRFRVLFNENKISYAYNLRDNFFETTIVSLGHSGGILKGLVSDPTQASDPYFVNDVKNQLYHLRREQFGRDLPAFNIQRGREHGIPGYVHYLDFCFGFKVQRWNDLVTFIPRKHLKKIRLFYKHWKDIDLFVGGVFERLLSGAAFGPTFGCINGIQFHNFKYGDRFYFEHGYQSGSFTPTQLDHIKEVSSLSSLICKTHTEVDQMPMNPFVQTSPHRNPMIPCFKFPEFDYDLWVDKKKGSLKYSTTMTKPPPVVYGSVKTYIEKPDDHPPEKSRPIGYSKKYHYQYGTKKQKPIDHQYKQEQDFNFHRFSPEESSWSVDHSSSSEHENH